MLSAANHGSALCLPARPACAAIQERSTKRLAKAAAAAAGDAPAPTPKQGARLNARERRISNELRLLPPGADLEAEAALRRAQPSRQGWQKGNKSDHSFLDWQTKQLERLMKGDAEFAASRAQREAAFQQRQGGQKKKKNEPLLQADEVRTRRSLPVASSLHAAPCASSELC